uniref:Uncharacterized protein n=1 Tax=Rhizochromulina marina TaxID=1034831 RepID=A0A7S2S5T0_9STRA
MFQAGMYMNATGPDLDDARSIASDCSADLDPSIRDPSLLFGDSDSVTDQTYSAGVSQASPRQSTRVSTGRPREQADLRTTKRQRHSAPAGDVADCPLLQPQARDSIATEQGALELQGRGLAAVPGWPVLVGGSGYNKSRHPPPASSRTPAGELFSPPFSGQGFAGVPGQQYRRRPASSMSAPLPPELTGHSAVLGSRRGRPRGVAPQPSPTPHKALQAWQSGPAKALGDGIPHREQWPGLGQGKPQARGSVLAHMPKQQDQQPFLILDRGIGPFSPLNPFPPPPPPPALPQQQPAQYLGSPLSRDMSALALEATPSVFMGWQAPLPPRTSVQPTTAATDAAAEGNARDSGLHEGCVDEEYEEDQDDEYDEEEEEDSADEDDDGSDDGSDDSEDGSSDGANSEDGGDWDQEVHEPFSAPPGAMGPERGGVAAASPEPTRRTAAGPPATTGPTTLSGGRSHIFRWQSEVGKQANMIIRREIFEALSRGTFITYQGILDRDPFWALHGLQNPDTLGRHLRDLKKNKKADTTGVFTAEDLERLWPGVKGKVKRAQKKRGSKKAPKKKSGQQQQQRRNGAGRRRQQQQKLHSKSQGPAPSHQQAEDEYDRKMREELEFRRQQLEEREQLQQQQLLLRKRLEQEQGLEQQNTEQQKQLLHELYGLQEEQRHHQQIQQQIKLELEKGQRSTLPPLLLPAHTVGTVRKTKKNARQVVVGLALAPPSSPAATNTDLLVHPEPPRAPAQEYHPPAGPAPQHTPTPHQYQPLPHPEETVMVPPFPFPTEAEV